MTHKQRPGLGAAVFVLIAFLVGGYFTIAAVQGDYGLFQRAEIEAQERAFDGFMEWVTTGAIGCIRILLLLALTGI